MTQSTKPVPPLERPESKPQGTLDDQKHTMDAEGPAAAPEPDELPASTDDNAERDREEKLVREGSGF